MKNDESIDISLFTLNERTNTLVAEVSELDGRLGGGEKSILVKENDKVVEYSYYKTDGDEDIYGWRYSSQDGRKLLIIND